jgi:hypothetical protein
MTYEQQVRRIPYTVCRQVTEHVERKIPYQVCRMVAETMVRKVPHQVCRVVHEERVEQIPVQVCRQVAVQQTVRVPRCVEKRVPVTCTYRVPRVVVHRVPVDPCPPTCEEAAISEPAPAAYYEPSRPAATVPAWSEHANAAPAAEPRSRTADETARPRLDPNEAVPGPVDEEFEIEDSAI